MPHIFVKDFQPTELKKPVIYSDNTENGDEVEFKFIAKLENDSEKNDPEFLIYTTISNKSFNHQTDFFLRVIQRKDTNNFLIKYDKKTRVSPNYFVQKSLDSLVKALNLEVQKSNLNIDKALVVRNMHFQNSDQNFKKLSFFNSDFFASDEFKKKELWIEIGFGSGRHILYQANKHKNSNVHIIGIEIYKPSIEQLLKQIEIQKLNNIWVVDFDARHFFEILPTSSVSKIFVHFPVPWDKKPERRIITKTFIQETKRILNLNGILELRTDSENYFQNSFNVIQSEKIYDINIQKNSAQIGVTSKYEDRWLKQEKNIYQVTFKNIEVIDSEKLKLIHSNENCSFEFKNIFETTEDLYKLKNTLLQIRDSFRESNNRYFFKDDDFFIRFSRFYTIKENQNYILVLIFGSYNYPDTFFVNIDLENKKISYLIKKPLNTFSNRKAHNFLKNIFRNNINLNTNSES